MFKSDKTALLQSLLFPVLIIIWGIARTVTDFLYAGGISAFTRLDALWRYVCFGAIICKRKTALIMIIKAVGTPRGIRTLITPKVFLCYQQYEP